MLPAVRLVRTGHDATGKSTVISDSPMSPFHPGGTDGPAFNIVDVRPEVPADNANPPDRAAFASQIPFAPPAGISVTGLDMPGAYARGTMHRTASVDYIFIQSGEITLVLDEEKEVSLRQGDCVQLQGSEHKWVNKTREPCRMLCFSAGAKELASDIVA